MDYFRTALIILLILSSNIPYAAGPGSKEAEAPSPPSPDDDSTLVVRFTMVSTAIVSVMSGIVLFAAHDETFYVRAIFSTPVIHSLDQMARVVFHLTLFKLTICEAVREIWSAWAAYLFWRLVEKKLKALHNVHSFGELIPRLHDLQFQIHYPFGLLEPTRFTGSLWLLRFLCLQTLYTAAALYSFRILLDASHDVAHSHVWVALINLAYFFTSSVGITAAHTFARGASPALGRAGIADKLQRFEVLLLLLWLVGPGVQMLHRAETLCVFVILYWFTGTMLYKTIQDWWAWRFGFLPVVNQPHHEP